MLSMYKSSWPNALWNCFFCRAFLSAGPLAGPVLLGPRQLNHLVQGQSGHLNFAAENESEVADDPVSAENVRCEMACFQSDLLILSFLASLIL